MKDDSIQDDQIINGYLTVIREQVNDDFIDILGLQKTGKGYRFNFFQRQILFEHQDFIDLSGEELSISVKKVLCKYLLRCPQQPLEKSGRLVTFREFTEESPLYYSFTENLSKIIEQTFSNQLRRLEEKSSQIYGMPVSNTSCDFSVRFTALPRIPIILQFNDVDDTMPAKTTFLFHEDAVNYLDLTSLGSIITYLTGILIN